MAPRDAPPVYDTLPPKRQRFGISGAEYIEIRRKEDGAQNLWRIYDRIYDLSSFIKSHPGGAHWIAMTKGMDITEMFESHHIGPAAERVLEKFSWKPATTPRRSPFTFKEDGFFKTCKRKAAIVLKDVHNKGVVTRTSAMISDTLATLAALGAIMAVLTGTYTYAMLSGLFIGLLFTSSHNFTHLRSNWRQYYVPVAMVSMHDWRVGHVLSHHHFPNTEFDMEVLEHEPVIDFYPRDVEPWKKWLQAVLFPVYAALMWPVSFLDRFVILRRWELPDFLNMSPLFVMLATTLVAGLGMEGVYRSFVMFVVTSLSHSFTANMIGFTVAHHHPDIYHKGDEPREDADWGLAQLDAVRDRADTRTAFLLSTLTFGDHSTHHLFPSLDHARLKLVRPLIDETLDEMGLKRMEESWPNLFVGMFQQILRSHGKPVSDRDMTKKKK